MNDAPKPIVVEQIISASIDKVWRAITQKEQMIQWFFPDIPSFEPRVGFETKFSVQSGGRNFTHKWTITEVEPGKKIQYRWAYDEYSGEGSVTFELVENGDHTLVRLINTGLETFPQDIPEFEPESCEAGWDYFIRQNLKNYLG